MRKYIVRRTFVYGCVIHSEPHIISFTQLNEMVNEVKKAFPFVKDEDIEILSADGSAEQWFPVIRFPLFNDSPTPEGWESVPDTSSLLVKEMR